MFLLEFELGRMDADHHQPVLLILLDPSTHIWKLAPPIDARESPEVDEDDLPAQACERQRRRVEPARRPCQRWRICLG